MKQIIRILFSILRSPLLIGSAISLAFYAVVELGFIKFKIIDEYFAGHAIEYVTTTLFLVGLASLFNKVVASWWSRSFVSRSRIILDQILTPELRPVEDPQHPTVALASVQETESGLDLPECEAIVEQLDQQVAARPADKVMRRVRDVLDRMVRSGSVDHLGDELRYASEVEADRVYDAYALFRVVIWAVPILGFLGTVVGITMAIANLSPEAMEKSLPLVVSSLSVAFATTIQALSLSIVLMLAKYLVGLVENNLAVTVDHEAERALLGRFHTLDDSPEGQLLAIRRMAETVVQASEQLVRHQTQLSEQLVRQQIQTSEQLIRQQAELWQKSIEASEQRWSQVTATAGKQLETALVTALSKSLQCHAEELSRHEAILAQQNHEHWSNFSASLQETVQSTTALEESVERQVGVLQRTVEATGQVARLEEALNRNLKALNNANQFEQVATSLSAAIHLLSGRLNETPASNIKLDAPEESSSAA